MKCSKADFTTKNMWKKIAVSMTAAVLLALLYILIFSFSAQDGEESGSLSYYISEKCVEIINSITGKHWTEVMMQGMAEYFEHPVRKLAHFSEYTIMGILIYVLLCQWIKTGRRLCGLTAAWVLLSAAADEFHQYFVPGRYASFLDVLLDTCGGLFGILLCVLVGKTLKRRAKELKCKSYKTNHNKTNGRT